MFITFVFGGSRRINNAVRRAACICFIIPYHHVTPAGDRVSRHFGKRHPYDHRYRDDGDSDDCG